MDKRRGEDSFFFLDETKTSHTEVERCGCIRNKYAE